MFLGTCIIILYIVCVKTVSIERFSALSGYMHKMHDAINFIALTVAHINVYEDTSENYRLHIIMYMAR